MFVCTSVIKTERKKERDGRKKEGRERKFVYFNFKRLMYKKLPKFICQEVVD